MENIKDFLEKLSAIEQECKNEKAKESKFNIFRALHKERDEKNLHSRFIAYLLSPTSTHGMDDLFLREFIKSVKKQYPQLSKFVVQDCEVRPNEKDKNEDNYMDIIISNNKQAILIENKIDASDSNRDDEEPQLKRYYNTLINRGYESNNIFVLYLTLDRRSPERKEEMNFNVLNIDYRTEINQWLNECIKAVNNNLIIKELIEQYLDVTIKITNDVNRALKLKKLISEQIEIAWEYKDKIIELEDFKHVKWHTVHEFWTLINKILRNYEVKSITNKDITKITHKGNGNSFGIIINDHFYLMNDVQNGLTFGKISETKILGKDWNYINEKIKFSEFSNIETFKLIDEKEQIIFTKQILAKLSIPFTDVEPSDLGMSYDGQNFKIYETGTGRLWFEKTKERNNLDVKFPALPDNVDEETVNFVYGNFEMNKPSIELYYTTIIVLKFE